MRQCIQEWTKYSMVLLSRPYPFRFLLGAFLNNLSHISQCIITLDICCYLERGNVAQKMKKSLMENLIFCAMQ